LAEPNRKVQYSIL